MLVSILRKQLIYMANSFVVSLFTKSLLLWCRMIHVRKSVKTSLCFMKLRSEDGACQQQWTQGCTRESAATDTRGSLLSALRARYCYLTFSVTVATAILNVAMWKNCWQSTWLTELLCRKSALRTKLVFQNQRESGRCGVGVLSWKEQIIIHVGMIYTCCQKSWECWCCCYCCCWCCCWFCCCFCCCGYFSNVMPRIVVWFMIWVGQIKQTQCAQETVCHCAHKVMLYRFDIDPSSRAIISDVSGIRICKCLRSILQAWGWCGAAYSYPSARL